MRILLNLIAGLLLVVSLQLMAEQQQNQSLEQYIARVEQLYLSEPESLPYQEVIELSREIIKNRELLNNNVIAKMFSLLSDSATNKGDLSKAMQFALDGESILGVDAELRLSLQLKIAAGHYFKGKYHQTKLIAEQAVELAKEINNPILLIKAMGYRAMANAVVAEHQLALLDLQQIQQLLSEYQEFNDHIQLLTVIANAHFYLGSYQTALKLYHKIKKIRFDLDMRYNIDQTFYHIARCYLQLGQYDDALHAFNGAKQYAEQKQAPIRVAYAELGLGQVLIKQQKFAAASEHLQHANQLFHGQNIAQPYLTTLLNLAQLHKAQNQQAQSFQFIQQAAAVIESTELTQEQIVIYQLLAEMHQSQGNYDKAFAAQAQYLALFKQFNHTHKHLVGNADANSLANEKNRELSLSLAAETELKNQFDRKYDKQIHLIISLVIVLSLTIASMLILAFKLRALRLNLQYDEIEKPTDILASPTQTKSFYQHYYKMARKFEYPLSVGYFSIDNWQELEFQFSNKIVSEVSRTIAQLVNQYKGEFDQVGLINQGEYLFLAPYQAPEQLKATFEQLTKAVKLQFFANLGEFSLKVSYDCQSPNVQDIDPYIFLSRLSESTRAEYSSYKT